ncbi:MAG: Rne/Rng family ribonuclease, partial [Myxococcota bacterium]|nr:Rne/Rng family ribonuclease [Myxococcota bacterium]
MAESSILLINAAGRETRVALVESGHIAEFYLERKKDKGVVGNIYKGRVVRVLPGMQAAFVDIGLEKAAFLYVSDVVYDPDFARAQFDLTEGEHDEESGEVPELHEGEEHPDPVEAGANGHGAHELHEAEVHEVAASDLPPPPAGEPVRRITTEIPVAVAPEAAAPVSGEPVAEPPPASAALDLSGVTAPLSAEVVDSASTAPPSEVTTEGAAGAAGPTVPPGDAEPVAQAPAGEVPPASVAASAAPASGAPKARQEERGERRAPRDRDQKPRESRRERGDKGGGRGRDRDEEAKPSRGKSQKIEDLLKVGQEVVVQISKDPIGTKGARLTSHISIPGRHLVFMPTVDHVGISRRIGNEKERRRLRDIVERLRPPGTGFIVRTVAENVPQEKLESDIRFLIEIWNQVVRKNEKRGGPGLMHPDLDLILRATRDLFAHDVEKLIIDDREEYERVLQFVTAQDPALKDRVIFHDQDEPIFDAFGIEQEINRAVQRKVWLKSGGYLIVDQAEALTAIDVNSGRYVGKKSLEETITKINIEAAKEIVYQLRLRNIGGIIICDFIDMEKAQNRDKVFRALQDALGRDKAKTNVLKISELGLVEMTRKRVRESIGRVLHEDCAYCEGKGFVKTATTVCYEIFRKIRRDAASYKDSNITVNVHPDVAKLLQNEEKQELRHLMDRYNKTIQVKPAGHYHREQYDIYARPPSAGDAPPRQQQLPQQNQQNQPKRDGSRSDREREQRRGGGEGRGGGDRGGGEGRGGGDRGGGEGRG